jgi:hypothetical protein
MSDALTDMVHDEKEQAKYFDEINKLAEYIGKRALKRPKELREKYIKLALSETNRNLNNAVNEYINAHYER